MTLFFTDTGGGAVSRVRPADTAFVHRAARHSIILLSAWDRPTEGEPRMQWARTNWRALEPYTHGFYANATTTLDKTVAQIRDNYGSNLDRLVALKRKYDPDNLFWMNANIPPAAPR